MFTNVASKYDLLNRMLTFGLDKRWCEACAKEFASGGIVVDLCCGTGDLSFQVLSRSTCMHVLGLDFNKEMLGKAVEKKSEWQKRLDHAAQQHGQTIDRTDLTFILADATYIPIKDGYIDRVGMSFSFRNLIYKNPKAMTYLKEIVRALRHTGKFICVETSQPPCPPVRALFHLYCLRIVPLLGWLVSGSRGPYKYLGKSAANFPPPQDIVEMLKKSGFRTAFSKHLSIGIAALYVASK
jgi:demethylmenaquinone methyltransferase/2-methoxy-6-polyprenyl-1,4-benzoquinol methylase